MKILHTSDLHIGAPLTSRLTPAKAQTRRRELLSVFDKLIDEARRHKAKAIIIAGDLFDDKRVTESVKQRILDSAQRAADITFIYTPGNHEGDTLAGEALPHNFKLLSGEGWSYLRIEDATFAARRAVGTGMFDDLEAPKSEVCIAILHGELRNYARDAISPKEAADRGIDYLALGHYHKYSETKIDEKTVAVYSGAPCGRGFDETGKLGYVIIDTDTKPISHSFFTLENRFIYEKEVGIRGALRTFEIERLISDACRDVRDCDILRVVLTGMRPIDFKPDISSLFELFSKKFWHFEIKDKTRAEIDVDKVKYDKTLKGEFIRLVLADESLSDTDKEGVIEFGIRALMGEIPDRD